MLCRTGVMSMMALTLSGAMIAQTGVDVTAPTLTSFSVSPTTVNTVSTTATVTVRFVASDDISGVNNVVVTVSSPNYPTKGISWTVRGTHRLLDSGVSQGV